MSGGTDKRGNIWFQSDQFLSNITKAKEFCIRKKWFREKWNLYAMFEITYESFWLGEQRKIKRKLIGSYKSDTEASLALSQARKIMGISIIEKSYIDLIEEIEGHLL